MLNKLSYKSGPDGQNTKGLMEREKISLGLIVGNRGFFPGHLAETGRAEMLKVLEQSGVDVVVLDAAQSKHGAIETYEEATRCAAHFRANGERIDGVIVALPNFGDERAIADTLRLSRLKVPVLVQATPGSMYRTKPFMHQQAYALTRTAKQFRTEVAFGPIRAQNRACERGAGHGGPRGPPHATFRRG